METKPDHSDALGNIEASALRILTLRDHSVLELRRKLESRFPGEGEGVAGVIERLIAQGTLDDHRCAILLAEQLERRGQGPLRITQALRQRGLVRAAADPGGEDPLAALRRAYTKRFGTTPVVDARDRAKRMRFLAGRGFTHEQIHRFFREVADPEKSCFHS
ncbi:MAG: regulatory protein RecX [Pseudomonadota bacterium]